MIVLNLLGGLVFSTIGFFVLRKGRRQSSFKAMGIGIALMVYPYFIPNTVLMYLVGVGLVAALFIG